MSPGVSRRIFALTTLVSGSAPAAMASNSRRVIDSAVHVWSTGADPFPWANPPPANLAKAATPDVLIAAAKEAGVMGALIVQPANHMCALSATEPSDKHIFFLFDVLALCGSLCGLPAFSRRHDHSYVTKALREHGDFFRGMGLANPGLPVTEAVKALEDLAAAGYVGIRFNAGAFDGGLTSEVAKALYKRAGELDMPVGVMAFKGLGSFLPALRANCEEFPDTKLVIDHFGFFRQPAIGGQLGDAAVNDEEAWKGLLSLAKFPQVFVKVSALFRASGEAPPHADLEPRVSELLRAFGPERLMWGSDFPFVTTGGFPLPEGILETPAAMTYTQASAVPSAWKVPELDDAALDALMGGTAARLFRFDSECS